MSKALAGADTLTWAFAVERVTGIESALSAWDSMALSARHLLILRPGRTWIVCPSVTVTSRGGSSVRARSRHALTTPVFAALVCRKGRRLHRPPQLK